tara:strand:- start:47 stop:376 length:330 start_codon:yes stop_codon:yes gene_type:complete
MAKKIIWPNKAHSDRLKIFEYWNKRNGTNIYSRKLFYLFKSATDLIKQYPNIGQKTDVEEVRSKLVKDYQIFYREIDSTSILILTIWDTRMDPKNKEEEIKKGRNLSLL